MATIESKEEAVEMLQAKNDIITTLFNQVEMRVEEYDVPEIMRHIQRLQEIQVKLEAKLIEHELMGIHIELPPL